MEQFSQAINTLVEKILLVTGSTICIILFAQVIVRYAGASLGWSEEVSRHLLVAITFLGGTVAYKRAGFIGLKGIGHHLGLTVARNILLCLQTLTLTCFLTIFGFGTVYSVKAWHQASASLQIPMAVPYAVIPAAAAILVIHVLADIQRTIRRSAR